MRQKSLLGLIYLVAMGCVMLRPLPGLAVTQSCDRAAQMAAAQMNVPLAVMLSIARVESGRSYQGRLIPWPWAVNLSGKSHYFPSKNDAMAFVQREIDQGNINVDIGCFQINLRWHSRNFASLDSALDPVVNARYAAQFLGDLYAEKGNWADAVAAYHSRTGHFAQDYLKKVKLAMDELKTPPNPTGQPDRPSQVSIAQNDSAQDGGAGPMRENRFPLLMPGRAENGSIVPKTTANQGKFYLR